MNAPPTTERRTDTPRRVIRALFEFRKSMLGFFVLFFLFLMVIAYNFPQIWEVKGQVLVKSGRYKAPTGVAYTNPSMRLDATMSDVASEMTIMISEPVRRRVAERLMNEQGLEEKPTTFFSSLMDGFNEFCYSIGLKPELEEGAALVEQLENRMTIEIEPGANVINLIYRHFGKRTAVTTMNFLLEEYLAQHTLIHSEGGALDFFTVEVAAKKAELDALQEEITAFRMSHDGGDLSQQRSLLVQDLNEDRQALLSLESVDESEENLLQASSLTEHPELATYYNRLLDLQQQIAVNEGINPDNEALARQQFESTSRDLLQQIRAKKAFLTRRVANLQKEVVEVEKDRAYYEDLLSRREGVEASYRQYAAKEEEERIAKAMDADQLTSVRVLQYATEPIKPYFPNRFVLALLGILLGVPGAVAFALLRSYFHSRVATVQDVESELGLPVLASLARLPNRAFAGGLPDSVMKGAKLVISAIDQAGVKTVCLASSTQGEGAATMASAVAVCAAKDGRKVVFATPDGVTNPAVTAEGIQVLDLSGMGVAEQKRAVSEAAAGCDLVIMSALPLAGADGGLYASSAEAAVFVVSGSGVHIEVARRGHSMLNRYCGKVLGAVLTQRRDPIPRLLYRRV